DNIRAHARHHRAFLPTLNATIRRQVRDIIRDLRDIIGFCLTSSVSCQLYLTLSLSSISDQPHCPIPKALRNTDNVFPAGSSTANLPSRKRLTCAVLYP